MGAANTVRGLFKSRGWSDVTVQLASRADRAGQHSSVSLVPGIRARWTIAMPSPHH